MNRKNGSLQQLPGARRMARKQAVAGSQAGSSAGTRARTNGANGKEWWREPHYMAFPRR